MDLLRQKVESDFQSLRKTLDTLNDSMSNLSVCLQEHKEQTTAELAHLQTSFNTTQSSHNTQLNNKLDDLNSKMCGLYSEVGTLSFKLDTQETSLSLHQQQTTAELAHLQTFLNPSQYFNNTQLNKKLESISTELYSKLDRLNSNLSQHQQQTTAELTHIQTSLNFKLDSLMATAAQLSSDHQDLQTNISDVQCMDTQQSLQENLAHQLETIKDCIESQPVYSCGGTGGWRRVVYLDMTDPHTTCPSGWNMTGYSKRTCGRNSTGYHTCSSATFPVSGGEYNRICGRIKAYQWGLPLAFFSYHYRYVTTIDDSYASSVSVTHGTPRNHIWTFVAGKTEGNPTSYEVCPCDTTSTIRVPPFVGNDYFCESGVNEPWNLNIHRILHPNDTLWDGEDCLPSSTCCSQHNPPYFTKQLPTQTTDDIEARICMFYRLQFENLAVELVELYVQ